MTSDAAVNSENAEKAATTTKTASDNTNKKAGKEKCGVCTEFKHWATKNNGESQRTSNSKPAADSEKTSETRSPGMKDAAQAANTAIECPPDSQQLGASTWTFLHTMASYYPDQPDANHQKAAGTLLNALSELYPCSYCAKHMRSELMKNPARVESRGELERWMCDLHNEVNERLGKPLFDCTRVRERWRDGKPECNSTN